MQGQVMPGCGTARGDDAPLFIGKNHIGFGPEFDFGILLLEQALIAPMRVASQPLSKPLSASMMAPDLA
jgi:hypothetical protein